MVSLDLPMPPSTNRLWRSVGQRVIKSEEYRRWLHVAGWRLKEQRARRVPGRVEVGLTVGKSTGDLDNRTKALLDLLVLHEVIEGDGPAIVRRIILAIDEEIEGCRVTVQPMSIEPFQKIGSAASRVVERLSHNSHGDAGNDSAA
jgi:Holliday junction resolvase RusA-like endonuclease